MEAAAASMKLTGMSPTRDLRQKDRLRESPQTGLTPRLKPVPHNRQSRPTSQTQATARLPTVRQS
eukprot:1506827-Pyramimonas_sp.AAC.1